MIITINNNKMTFERRQAKRTQTLRASGGKRYFLGRESSIATMTESGSVEHHRWLTTAGGQGQVIWLWPSSALTACVTLAESFPGWTDNQGRDREKGRKVYKNILRCARPRTM